MAGNVIGPYRLGKTLGIGSFSKVKIAVHEITGQKVAIKILNRKKLKSMDMGAKVSREIKILRLFAHPHIIRLYEVIDTPTDIFVVMEYVPSGELFDYIVTRGKLSEDDARRFFQQIISGVDYCHTHMVVHRDLKPENLLLDSDNNVKLADFGLSNMMRDGHFLSTSCGSPNYAAPEVISGNLYAGPEVDVWSCGVILYALLCGSLPFDDDNIANLFRKIKSGIYHLPSHLSEGARDLIPKMLIVDPMKRISMPQIRKHPWFLKNLPQYLLHIPEPVLGGQQVAVNEDVLREMESLGFDHRSVLEALSFGPDLLTDARYALHFEHRKVAVAYHLLLDKKRRTEQDMNPANIKIPVIEEKKRRPLSSTGTPASRPQSGPNSPALGASTASPFGSSQPPALSLSGNASPSMAASASSTSPNPNPSAFSLTSASQAQLQQLQQQQSSSAAARRWFVGVWTTCDPATIMADVFRALKTLGFEWKILSPYKLKTRYPSQSVLEQQQQQLLQMAAASSSSDSSAASTALTMEPPKLIKLGLQLYKTPRSRYVLDVQKLYGETFVFMNLCAKLMTELRI